MKLAGQTRTEWKEKRGWMCYKIAAHRWKEGHADRWKQLSNTDRLFLHHHVCTHPANFTFSQFDFPVTIGAPTMGVSTVFSILGQTEAIDCCCRHKSEIKKPSYNQCCLESLGDECIVSVRIRRALFRWFRINGGADEFQFDSVHLLLSLPVDWMSIGSIRYTRSGPVHEKNM